jgi:structural maintenance of chromosome 2
MQGRITKVLNMKPIEILSMIEEAAGTRMFETKKQTAIKTLEKKQLKVDELTKTMTEEIDPNLTKLREERQKYQTWLAQNNDLISLERLCVAYNYCQCVEEIETFQTEKLTIQDQLISLEETETINKEKIDSLTKQIHDICHQRDDHVHVKLNELKTRESELSKDIVRLNTLYRNHDDTVKSESLSILTMKEQIQQNMIVIDERKSELLSLEQMVINGENDIINAEKQAKLCCEKYENACAGMADESNTDLLSLPEQIACLERRQRDVQSHIQQLLLRRDHLHKKCDESKKTIKSTQTEYNKLLKEQQIKQNEIQQIESNLSMESFNETHENVLRQQIHVKRGEIASIRDNIQNLSTQLNARLHFEFKDPVRNFDRSKVKGLVARLIRVPQAYHATALEIAAGAKLYQVVVDTEETGKMILKNGQLKKRITILPLNKIDNRMIDPVKMVSIKNLASSMGGQAMLGIELVGYDDEVKNAIQYVFGNAVICDSSDIAKAITFDKSLRTKTVTLDGDCFDPTGTLTGGSKNEIGALLTKLTEIASEESRVNGLEFEMAQLVCEFEALQAKGAQFRDGMVALESLRESLLRIETQIANCSYIEIKNQMESLTEELSAIDEVLRLFFAVKHYTLYITR